MAAINVKYKSKKITRRIHAQHTWSWKKAGQLPACMNALEAYSAVNIHPSSPDMIFIYLFEDVSNISDNTMLNVSTIYE
jgi:hypothetical protein